jgi:putative MFS transporter
MSADVGAVPVQTAIDRIGFGRFQKRLLGVCGVTWAADAAEIFLIAFALPSITKDFDLSTFESSLVVSATFVGMLAGAWFWGTISDRIGRRRGFAWTIGIFAFFGLLSAFSPNMWTLCLLRVLAGFGLGGAVPLDFSLFAEYLPTKKRGRWLVILESFWGVGTVVAAGLAWVLVPTLGWRYLLATSAAAGALVFWVRLRIPESPRYLAATGRTDEAEAILRQIARENGVPEREVPRIEPPTDASDKVEIKRLFEGRLARTTLMLWSTWFFIALAYYGLFSWMPKILAERGLDVVKTYGYTLLLAAAQLPGYFSAAWLVERWGRKRTFVVYLAISAVCTFIYGAADNLTVLLTAAVLMSFFALGAWASLYAYTPELLPTRMRTTGMGAASGMARVAGVLAPLIGGLLLPISLGLTLTVYALSFALAALSVAILGHETRDVALADTVAEEEAAMRHEGRFTRRPVEERVGSV